MESSAGRLPIVEMRGISKRFHGHWALKDVDLTIYGREVTGLVGQNGSGKSTLVKILSGYHDPEPGGSMLVGGQPVELPLGADRPRELGFSFVHQHLGLASNLTVSQNLKINQWAGAEGFSAFGFITWRDVQRQAAAILSRYDVDLDPDAIVGGLAPVDQARLAIVRAAEDLREFRERSGAEHSLLVLDEPTVFLPEQEIERLFAVIRTVVSAGSGVILISHEISTLRRITDRIVVLRDGLLVGDWRTRDLDEQALIERIVGAPTVIQVGRAARHAASPPEAVTPVPDSGSVVSVAPRGSVSSGSVRIEGVVNERIREFGLTIEPGEIVGVAGLLGSGAEDLPYVLFGARGGSRGTVSFGGAAPLDLARLEPAKSVREGMALIPADRELLGLCLSMTVHENLTMLVQEDYYEAGRVNQDKLLEQTRNALKVLSVKPNDPLARMSSLSGGNKQKVMVAKWLLRDPRLILLHEPTQGVDVGAREEIYDEIRRFVDEKGRSAVWVSSDFDELANVCDRVIVMAKGEVVDELDAQDLTGDSITAYVLAAGKVA